ncbi:MAG TPA: family 16 glycoside hydrolase [Verrucomicrobiae bacterium]|nr:family 16 glycoside hydrolase [Verrucomicrobiae bacterium]
MGLGLNCLMALLALPVLGAEQTIDFGSLNEGQTPPGFRSAVTGQGKPGDWRIVMDDVPPLMARLSPGGRGATKRAVLAQLARDTTDEHFPLLIFEDETFGDFKLTTSFKIVDGRFEEMAGIAFRVQDERNYYVVRASSLGNNFRFYKVLNGSRGPLVGPQLSIPPGGWHQLTIECHGSDIACSLDGKQLISVSDKANPLTSGKIAFWTKSDSVSYFGDTKIVYTPLQPPAVALVRKALKKYNRLLALKIYVPGKEPRTTRVVASQDEKELGQPGSHTEMEVIARGETYYGKENGVVSVIAPLRDRNGDAIAAVRVTMKSFPGQTEANAIVRATPIVKELQSSIQSLDDLTD